MKHNKRNPISPSSGRLGNRVDAKINPGGYELIATKCPVSALKGLFGTPERSVSIEEMNAAIAARGASAR